nr:lysine-specific demethylase 8-like [Ciona intestinalis]|eukprot:XP_002126088.2 lysine-specific demethylase 8-like [Ciona intestinalis]
MIFLESMLFRLIAFLMTSSVHCDILFPKDTSTDFVFPPKIRRSTSGVPDGHLRPLGWQRPPEGKVPEITEAPEPKTFWESHVRDKKPLVMRQAINQSSDCFVKWNDKYLKNTYGDVIIEVTKKKPGKIEEPHMMTLKKFLLRYNLEDWYLVSPIPPPMTTEVPAIKSLLCGTFRDFLQEAEMWMSSGGTSSPIHYDQDHNIHCLIAGRKDFIMVHPKFKDRFEMKENKEIGNGYSTIDAEMVNVYDHPKVGKTAWKWSTLWPGDCIYLPAGHLHQVRSYGRSLSTSILWTPTRAFNDTGCAVTNMSEPVALSELSFIWKLYDGQRLINTDNYDDPETLRHHLLALMRDDPKLPRERFFHYFEKARNDESRRKEQTPHAAFRQLDLKKKNYLTVRDIQRLPSNLLTRVVNNYIRPQADEVEELLKDEL